MSIELTPRQRQVLQLLVDGHSRQEIAQHLQISVATVALHRRNLLTKFKARNTAHLIVRAHRLGYV